MTLNSSRILVGQSTVAKAGLRMWLSKVSIQVWPSGGDLAAIAAADHAGAARLVVDDDLFQPVWSIELGLDDARHRVGRAAGREGDDDLDRPLGPIAGLREVLGFDDGGRAEGRCGAADQHARGEEWSCFPPGVRKGKEGGEKKGRRGRGGGRKDKFLGREEGRDRRLALDLARSLRARRGGAPASCGRPFLPRK